MVSNYKVASSVLTRYEHSMKLIQVFVLPTVVVCSVSHLQKKKKKCLLVSLTHGLLSLADMFALKNLYMLL